MSGERPAPKRGPEILAAARMTDFVEEGGLTSDHEYGSVEFVPAAFTPDAIGETIAHGRLLFRFTISGSPPQWLSGLTSGTYYAYVDFVEGPDFDEGRWVGRIVDEEGTVVNEVPGVEVKEVFHFHLHDPEEHNKPSIRVHGLGEDEQVPEGQTRIWDGQWSESVGDWHPYADGCRVAHYCFPIYLSE
jgi:hypothetical protein